VNFEYGVMSTKKVIKHEFCNLFDHHKKKRKRITYGKDMYTDRGVSLADADLKNLNFG
jgi:hypothetical protein